MKESLGGQTKPCIIITSVCKTATFSYLDSSIQGEVAEWLGRGLQNLVQRFESALRLQYEAGLNLPAKQKKAH